MRVIFFLGFLLSGTYYEFLACGLSIALFVIFVKGLREEGLQTLVWNCQGMFFLILPLFYLCSTLWAVDRNLAFLGFLKFLPLGIFALLLMQRRELSEQLLEDLPFAGTVMTVISFIGSNVPSLASYFLVNGRLAGTFQYPNTFAIFLLIALLYILVKSEIDKIKITEAAVILIGIFSAGSRTVFVMIPFALAAAFFTAKERRNRFLIFTIFLAGFFAAAVGLCLSTDSPLDRISQISLSDSTFLGRLLYWKDALPVILKHPFGLGYMGYYFMQGSFQTGVYTVTHVHNEFIQLFLDVGWIPGFAFIGVIFRGFWKTDSGWKRLLLSVLIFHCMMDFDLQYIAVYLILMMLLPWGTGKERSVPAQILSVLMAVVVTAALVYFGIGNAVYYFSQGQMKGFYPENTFGQAEELKQAETVEEMGLAADRILSHNTFFSLAWSAKAEAAYSKGDIQSMMQYKRNAILLARYTMPEYEDYLNKLFTAAEMYRQNGDEESAAICLRECLWVKEQLKRVEKETDSLAWSIDDKPELELSQEYQDFLNQIKDEI